MQRTPSCYRKLERMNKTLKHQEADRVPVSDFYWGSFIERWRTELGLPPDTDIYKYYDMDWMVTMPNMDPHIRSFEVVSQSDTEITVRTGFEAVIRKKFADPMPAFLSFDTNTLEKMASFQFDDPWDPRRYFSAGDNQLAGVGDGFAMNTPAWIDSVKSLYPEFPVYGSVTEGHEMLWRILGSERVMEWIGLYPDEIARFVERILEFELELVEAQIQAASGLLDGMVIWGDVAYTRTMFFSPRFWRRVFKPGVQAIIEKCHAHNLPVIYHGCGNARSILPDFVEIGLDAYNPLEAKAGLDVVDLRRQFGHTLAFCGNMNVIEWAEKSPDELIPIVLRKLNAAKGGGYIFQSDHSVPSNISGMNYDFVVNLVRQYGQYPLKLGDYNLEDVG